MIYKHSHVYKCSQEYEYKHNDYNHQHVTQSKNIGFSISYVWISWTSLSLLYSQLLKQLNIYRFYIVIVTENK